MRVIAVVLAVLWLSGCGGKENPHSQVTVEEAEKLIYADRVEVIDVRTPEEYAQGHISGAVNMPLDTLEARLSELAQDQPYLLVCRSGSRSAQAQQLMEQHGFAKTYNMQGGVSAYPGPLVTGQGAGE